MTPLPSFILTPHCRRMLVVSPSAPSFASHGQVAFLPFTPDTMESIVKLHIDQLGQQLVMDGTRWQQVRGAQRRIACRSAMHRSAVECRFGCKGDET